MMCFSVFSVLMACAALVATQFSFRTQQRMDDVRNRVMDSQTRYVDSAIAETAKARAPEPIESSSGKIMSILRTFSSPDHAAFLFIAFWTGFGAGLVFAFLFWHLQDLGGSPTLFGIASIINHASELGAYIFGYRLINSLGHMKVLYIGLIANFFRFLYISFISEPYWVLPFEFVQGLCRNS